MPQAGPAAPGRRQPARLARGPRAAAHPAWAAIDDATGMVTAATFRDAGGHRRLPRRSCATRSAATASRAPLPRPPRHLRDPRAARSPLGGAAGRHPGPDPGRAGPRRARDPLDRGPQPPGQGPHRARLGHPARTASSSSCGWPGACDRETRQPRSSRRYLPRFNRRFAVPGRPTQPGLAAGAGRDPARPGLLRCGTGARSPGDHTVRAGATILQLPAGPGAGGARPASGSSSSCGSTAGSSCGTGSGTSSPRTHPPIQSSSGRSRWHGRARLQPPRAPPTGPAPFSGEAEWRGQAVERSALPGSDPGRSTRLDAGTESVRGRVRPIDLRPPRRPRRLVRAGDRSRGDPVVRRRAPIDDDLERTVETGAGARRPHSQGDDVGAGRSGPVAGWPSGPRAWTTGPSQRMARAHGPLVRTTRPRPTPGTAAAAGAGAGTSWARSGSARPRR